MKLPVKKEFPYLNKTGAFIRFDVFVIAFVYPHPDFGEAHVVKGGRQEVEEYILHNNGPCIVHLTCYRGGHPTTLFRFYHFKEHFYISKRHVKPQFYWDRIKTMWILTMRDKTKNFSDPEALVHIAKFKTLPRKWIRELTPYISFNVNSRNSTKIDKIFNNIGDEDPNEIWA